jgi:phosphoribosylanthranilate isomerase
MTWVKLCGMRTRADVEAAEAAGADAVGFVVVSGSPRSISPDEARRAGEGTAVDRFVLTVGLETEEVLEVAAAAGATGVQLYGEHAGEAARVALGSGLRVLFPIRVSGPPDLSAVPEGAVPLLDTAVPGVYGGTGRSFDWSLAAGIGREVVIAGGLHSGNVAEAVRVARPWGVDVSSGIESAPGVKDHEEMRRFVEALR